MLGALASPGSDLNSYALAQTSFHPWKRGDIIKLERGDY